MKLPKIIIYCRKKLLPHSLLVENKDKSGARELNYYYYLITLSIKVNLDNLYKNK